MRHAFGFILGVLAVTSAFGQNPERQRGNDPLYESFLAGGVAFSTYYTYWYYTSPNILNPFTTDYHYPIHVFDRTLLTASYHMGSLFGLGPVTVSSRTDVQFGIAGGTKEDWLPAGESISSGGMTVGLSGLLLFSYPLELIPARPLALYVGTGLQFILLESNGKDVGTTYASNTRYDYASGWTEYIGSLPFVAGASVSLGSVIVSLEYREMITGGGGTDWEPTGSEPEEDGHSGSFFILSAGFRI